MPNLPFSDKYAAIPATLIAVVVVSLTILPSVMAQPILLASAGALSSTVQTAVSTTTEARAAMTITAPAGTRQPSATDSATEVAMSYSSPWKVGERGPAGGIIFYDKGGYADGWRYLEAASTDQSAGIPWAARTTGIIGTSPDLGQGKVNTEAIVSRLGNGGYAARLCYNLVLGGFNDWFLPSRDELSLMYGQQDIIGSFAPKGYWSSSEYNEKFPLNMDFRDGAEGAGYKDYKLRVRAVRAF
jgi:hypothetical protein